MLKTLLVAGAATGALFIADRSEPSADHGSAVAATVRAAEEFEIDGAHSSVLFRVQHIKAAPFWGTFQQVSGRLLIDDEDLDGSFVRVEIPTDSVYTRAESRDRHLKGPDFLSVKEFPKMTFESTKIEKVGDDRYRITGDLTLRGVTKSVTAEAEHTGTAEVSPRFGKRCGYEAIFEIDRTDFGVSYGADNGVLGKTVRIVIAVEGKLAK